MSSSPPRPSRELPMSDGELHSGEDSPMSAGESNPIRDAIAQAIEEHKVILFMKGTPEAPACGFSARTVAALQALDAPFAAVDVLPDPRIRQELSAISNWPTIPQLFANGELVGGCDIVIEMYESGELAQTLGLGEDGGAASAQELADEAQPAAQGLTQVENRLG
jgi:monothiol glutaredoxin